MNSVRHLVLCVCVAAVILLTSTCTGAQPLNSAVSTNTSSSGSNVTTNAITTSAAEATTKTAVTTIVVNLTTTEAATSENTEATTLEDTEDVTSGSTAASETTASSSTSTDNGGTTTEENTTPSVDPTAGATMEPSTKSSASTAGAAASPTTAGSVEDTTADGTTDDDTTENDTTAEGTTDDAQTTRADTTQAATATEQVTGTTGASLQVQSIIQSFKKAVNGSSNSDVNETAVIQGSADFTNKQNDTTLQTFEETTTGQSLKTLMEHDSSAILEDWDRQLSGTDRKVYFYALLIDLEVNVENRNLLNFFGDPSNSNLSSYTLEAASLLQKSCEILRNAGSEPEQCKSTAAAHNNVPLIVGCVVGGAVLLALLVGLGVYLFKRAHRKKSRINPESIRLDDTHSMASTRNNSVAQRRGSRSSDSVG